MLVFFWHHSGRTDCVDLVQECGNTLGQYVAAADSNISGTSLLHCGRGEFEFQYVRIACIKIKTVGRTSQGDIGPEHSTLAGFGRGTLVGDTTVGGRFGSPNIERIGNLDFQGDAGIRCSSSPRFLCLALGF